MRVRETIRRMQPYTPPLEGRDPKQMLLLDFNESLIPPPPPVREAIIRFLDENRMQTYPDYGDFEPRLARYLGVNPDEVLITNGSDQGIEVVFRAFLEKEDPVLFPEPTFSMYRQIAQTLDARVVTVAYGPAMEFPAQQLEAAITPATRLLMLASPNNPTGKAVPAPWLEGLLERHPRLAVVVDEAYHEFCGETFIPLLRRHANLAVIRTFSKAFALAGLRLGVVVGRAEFMAELKKIRGPYDMNMLAVVAARAQLDHPQAMTAYIREVMDVAKPKVEAFLTRHGVRFYPSDANFLLISLENAGEAAAWLQSQNILVRPQKSAPGTFRLTIGPLVAMERFMEAFARFLSR